MYEIHLYGIVITLIINFTVFITKVCRVNVYQENSHLHFIRTRIKIVTFGTITIARYYVYLVFLHNFLCNSYSFT